MNYFLLALGQKCPGKFGTINSAFLEIWVLQCRRFQAGFPPAEGEQVLKLQEQDFQKMEVQVTQLPRMFLLPVPRMAPT